MPHELYLSAFVAFEDHTTALRILQGFCGANPESILRRRLIWEGPRSRDLKSVGQKVQGVIARKEGPNKQAIDKQKAYPWIFLRDQLVRQSYRITLIYDVKKEDFSKPDIKGSSLDCDAIPGTLSWKDIPAPVTNLPVNSRLALDIQDEISLCSTLRELEYGFVLEFLQESYRFVYRDVVFYMSRYLEYPQDAIKVENGVRTSPMDVLPPFESLEPYDAEDKWVLTASVEIQNGNDQGQIKDAVAQLLHVKKEFIGCFDFQVIDRVRFDTRTRM